MLENSRVVLAQGIVTQVTDVKPLMTVATYLDDATGYEVYQEVIGELLLACLRCSPRTPRDLCCLRDADACCGCRPGKEFTPLQTAPDPGAASSARAILHLQTRGSKFVRFQEARMQELASEVLHLAPHTKLSAWCTAHRLAGLVALLACHMHHPSWHADRFHRELSQACSAERGLCVPHRCLREPRHG